MINSTPGVFVRGMFILDFFFIGITELGNSTGQCSGVYETTNCSFVGTVVFIPSGSSGSSTAAGVVVFWLEFKSSFSWSFCSGIYICFSYFGLGGP